MGHLRVVLEITSWFVLYIGLRILSHLIWKCLVERMILVNVSWCSYAHAPMYTYIHTWNTIIDYERNLGMCWIILVIVTHWICDCIDWFMLKCTHDLFIPLEDMIVIVENKTTWWCISWVVETIRVNMTIRKIREDAARASRKSTQ